MKHFKLLSVLLPLLLLFSLINCAVPSAAASPVVIGIHYISPYGTTDGHLIGCVFKEDYSDFEYGDYFVKAYLQTVTGGEFYIKPYTDKRQITELNPTDGTFDIDICTGGIDEYAINYRVELYSKSDSAKILDTVYISRPSNGVITVSPVRKLPSVVAGKPSNLPITEDKIGLCVGLYTDPGMHPDYTVLSEEHIKKHLQALKPFTDSIRLYGVGEEMNKVYEIANNMGFKIIACANLGYSQTGNKEEIENLIELCNKYESICVSLLGNEALLTNKVSASYLVEQMEYVKEKIPDRIAVSTADTIDTYFNYPQIRSAVDVMYIHIYSYWSYSSPEASRSISRIEEFSDAFSYMNKELIIGESGLATEGSSRIDLTLNGDYAAKYYTEMQNYCFNNGIKLMYFEGFDENWKSGNEGTVGAHWGLLSSDGQLKSAYSDLDFFKNAYKNFLKNSVLPSSVTVNAEKSYIYGSGSDFESLRNLQTNDETINMFCDTSRIGTASLLTFTLNGNVVATYKAVVFGDINGDGVTDVLDISECERAVNKHTVLKDTYSEAADADGNGSIGIEDYSSIVNAVISDSPTHRDL